MKKFIIYLLPMLYFLQLKATAQTTHQGLELLEIMQISDAYRLADDISFSITYTYADSTTPQSIAEQLQGHYKIHHGKYWGMLDSVEFMQGNLFNMAVYHRDSIIVVNNRQEYTQVMQLPLMDSLFRKANIASMSVKDSNDSTRQLTIQFNAGAPYRSYSMEYNKQSFLLSKIKYYLSDNATHDDPHSSGVVCVGISFLNYSTAVINEDVFDESRFVYRQAGEVLTKPAYRGFRVMAQNATPDKQEN